MTSTPPWGTPSWGTPLPGEVGPAPEPSPRTARYLLVVEQTVGSGESAVWRVDPEPMPAGSSREAARSAALQLARTFRPHHPYSPRARSILRISDDSYLVLVEGMTKTFHFRVTVAEHVP